LGAPSSAGAGDDRAGGIGGLREDSQKARGTAAHVIERQQLHDRAAHGDTDGVAKTQQANG
jgi:hypothetical protein